MRWLGLCRNSGEARPENKLGENLWHVANATPSTVLQRPRSTVRVYPKAEESKEVERELSLCWQVAAGSAQIVHLLVLRNPMVVLPLGLEGVVDSFLVYSPCQS
jgi:hypothetical protein